MNLTQEKQVRKDMLRKTEQIVSSSLGDLATIEGDGSFSCPKCGMLISSEDETEENYKVIDTKFINNMLDSLIVACGNCKNVIILTGFQQVLH